MFASDRRVGEREREKLIKELAHALLEFSESKICMVDLRLETQFKSKGTCWQNSLFLGGGRSQLFRYQNLHLIG